MDRWLECDLAALRGNHPVQAILREAPLCNKSCHIILLVLPISHSKSSKSAAASWQYLLYLLWSVTRPVMPLAYSQLPGNDPA
jgi:hypothetical protein